MYPQTCVSKSHVEVFDFCCLETTSSSPYMYLMLDIPPSPLYKVLLHYFFNNCLYFLLFLIIVSDKCLLN